MEWETSAEIRSPDFTARVPLSFTIISSDEVDYTEYEESCAMKAVAVLILTKHEKEIRNQMQDIDDYGYN